MQLHDVRPFDPPRALSPSYRSSSDSSGFAPPQGAMAGDRAQIRTRTRQKAPKQQPLNLALGWAALAFLLLATLVALALGTLGGALGLLLGWLSAALAVTARRELLAILERAMR